MIRAVSPTAVARDRRRMNAAAAVAGTRAARRQKASRTAGERPPRRPCDATATAAGRPNSCGRRTLAPRTCTTISAREARVTPAAGAGGRCRTDRVRAEALAPEPRGAALLSAGRVPRRSPDGVVECATSARVGPARGVPATAGGDTLAAAVAGAIEGVDLGGAGVSLGGG